MIRHFLSNIPGLVFGEIINLELTQDTGSTGVPRPSAAKLDFLFLSDIIS